MSRLAIIGSCITRDLWPGRVQGPDDLLYVSRTSLPSLFSPAVRGFEPPAEAPEGLGPYQHRAIVWDLKKRALAALVAHRPSHLIVDFIDERFDLLQVSRALATRSWELEASGYLEHPVLSAGQVIPRLSAACERLWMSAVEEFAAFLRETPLRDAALILHEARWAETQHGPEGAPAPVDNVEIIAGRPADLGLHNALLARYEAAFLAAAPHAIRVAAPDQRLADPGHRWGLSPFHYAPAYYSEIRRQLRETGVF